MSKKIICTDKAPKAIGPYSQAVRAGNLIITSGQLPIDPSKGTMPEGIVEQARQALNNLQAVLQEAGAGMESVIKTLVFLDDMGDFAAFNEVYAGFFPENPPARSCVQAAALPLNALVEVEATAIVSN